MPQQPVGKIDFKKWLDLLLLILSSLKAQPMQASAKAAGCPDECAEECAALMAIAEHSIAATNAAFERCDQICAGK